MSFTLIVIFITSTLLLADTLYSLYNFQYTYFMEIKKRYANLSNIPITYKKKLTREVNDDTGITRRYVQTLYIFWFIFIIFTKLIFLPVIISIVAFSTNLAYRKAYIAPSVLLFNLIVSFMVYLFVILTFYFKLI